MPAKKKAKKEEVAQVVKGPSIAHQILTPDFLGRLKDGLEAKVYTDEQLNRAAYFWTVVVMTVAAEIGAADGTNKAIMVTANLLAGGFLAEYINAGLISVTAIDRYVTRVEGQDGQD